MPIYCRPQSVTEKVTNWSGLTLNMSSALEEAVTDVDEPPDHTTTMPAISAALEQETSPRCSSFRKKAISRPQHVESLLTRALQSQSEDETVDSSGTGVSYAGRRRSITSIASLASTADFTSDTGITTPPRTKSPSPRNIKFGLPSSDDNADETPQTTIESSTPKADATPTPQPPRKRCISFACAAVPKSTANATEPKANGKEPAPQTTKSASAAAPTSQNTQPRRPCIKFVCPARPSEARKPNLESLKVGTPDARKMHRKPSPAPVPRSPVFARKMRGSSSGRSPHPTPTMSAPARSKKYLTVGPEELKSEWTHFHEMASDAPMEADWIRHAKSESQPQKLTINDTLKKEMAIRLLAKEAEEEAELEDDDDDEENEDDDDEDAEDDDEEDEDEDDDDEDDEDDDEDDEDDEDDDVDENDTIEGDHDHLHFDDFSDGYNTDNEIGFASSDEEDDGLDLWTVNHPNRGRRREQHRDTDHSTLHEQGTPVFRRLSVDDHSDTSSYLPGQLIIQGLPKGREDPVKRAATPELPDSTDFVCGTFDEDRPLEEAYVAHMQARRREKTRTIPQDIDPSFPTSDPEEEEEPRPKTKAKQQQQQQQQQQRVLQPNDGSVDGDLWQLDDVKEYKKQQANGQAKLKESPKRYHSPPPPKARGQTRGGQIRGRSPAPRRLFDRQSPTSRRLKSPAPKAIQCGNRLGRPQVVSPPASPVSKKKNGTGLFYAQPGLTQAKSLPRPRAIFRQQCAGQGKRRQKPMSTATTKPMHIRGAIDIVKGLERKRQRRKEKFQQKYCNRARKGQVPEKRIARGDGAAYMREIGLLMAGKIGQGNYVMSI